MSYHVYTTKGLVLSERPLGEADRVYNVFTRDLGLLQATARGVRKESSKLRGSLEPFTLSSISFVRGREYWRLTNTCSTGNYVAGFRDWPEISRAFAKNLSLFEKLAPAEEKLPELFDDFEEILKSVGNGEFDQTDAEGLEILLASRILFNLGYLSESDAPSMVIAREPSLEICSIALSHKNHLVKLINNGIQASHLT